MTEDNRPTFSPEDLGLVPVVPIDSQKITSVDEFMHHLGNTAFEGGNLGRSAETLLEMARSKDISMVLTVAGAMIPAGMGLLVCDMIDQGWVQELVITGAQVAHGLVESAGRTHWRMTKHIPDEVLQDLKINRINDVAEPEENLDYVEEIIKSVIEHIAQTSPRKTFSSRLITHELGKYLHDNFPDRGMLKSAYEMGVPVFITPLSDSEVGLDFKINNDIRYQLGKRRYDYDEFIDQTFYSELITRQVERGNKLGIFTIGGGVPRNWAQQEGPYIELREQRLQAVIPDYKPIQAPMFQHAMRISAEPEGLGGLSGCPYSEGISWRKFSKDAVTAEVHLDATVAWPLVVQAVLQRLNFQPVQKDVFAGKEAIAKVDAYIKQYYPSAA